MITKQYPIHEDILEVHPRAGNIFPKTTNKHRCWYCHNSKKLFKDDIASAFIRKDKDKWYIIVNNEDTTLSIPIECCPKCGRTLI